MHKKAEESSIQYSCSVDASVCVHALQMCVRARALQMCAWKTSHMWDWTRMHALVVMHRQTLCKNVDSAKIKVPFYTTNINILRVASIHRIVIHRIDISIVPYRWIITPLYTAPSIDVVQLSCPLSRKTTPKHNVWRWDPVGIWLIDCFCGQVSFIQVKSWDSF